MNTATPPLLHRGKVRDTYVGEEPDTLVVVATDRISTYDVVHPTPVSGKGVELTHVTNHWLTDAPVAEIVPNHLVSTDISMMPGWILDSDGDFVDRTMVVRQLNMLPLEAIVRGYITGSGWKDYNATGMVSGVKLPAGMQEMERFDEPIFTPSTKAQVGHDENVDFEFMVNRLLEGKRALAEQVRAVSLELYTKAAEYALERGIILVDTKFEFGLDPETGELVLGDEVLTPDSSRYVAVEDYVLGKPPKSMDKQYVRDWASSTGWNKKPPAPPLPDDIVAGTIARYKNVALRLTGSDPLD
jgi:phosphoribosylaminoimidazole-succinocarboxamide synthase